MTSSDLEHASRLSELYARERDSMVAFLLSLAEFDSDRKWERLGYNSLFAFLTAHLKMSESTAGFRVRAVRVISRFGPQVAAALRDGKLCISVVYELDAVLTDENCSDVLPRFFGLSRTKAQALAAELAPRAAVVRRTVVTPLQVER